MNFEDVEEAVDKIIAELDLSERLVWIVEPERVYTRLVMNAQLNADGTCLMADGTVKYWKPFKY